MNLNFFLATSCLFVISACTLEAYDERKVLSTRHTEAGKPKSNYVDSVGRIYQIQTLPDDTVIETVTEPDGSKIETTMMPNGEIFEQKFPAPEQKGTIPPEQADSQNSKK